MSFYQQKTTARKSASILYARVGVLVWVVAICFLSFSPLQNVPLPNFFSADKLAHIMMYFILVCLINFASLNLRNWHIGLLFAVLFSMLTELIQHYFVVNRFGEFADFFANFIGISIGYFIFKRRIKT